MNRALAALGLILCIAYWPYINGAATAPRWMVIAACVPLLLFLVPRVEITRAHVVGFLFVAWSLLTLTWTATWYDSVDAAWKLVLLVGCFALGSALSDLRPLYRGMAIGIGISSILVLTDALGLFSVPKHHGLAGLFVNSLFLAEIAALVLVGAFANFLPWPYLVAVAPSVFLTGGRAPLLAIGVVFVARLWRTSRDAALATIAVLCIGAMIAIVLRPDSVFERLDIWSDTLRGLSAFGHGLGSFAGLFPQYARLVDASANRFENPHNEFLQIAFETGIPGLVLALAFCWLILKTESPERYVFIAFVVEACFAFPNHLPCTAFLAALVAGHAARALPVVRLGAAERGIAERAGLDRHHIAASLTRLSDGSR